MESDQAEAGLPVLRHRVAVPDRSRHRQGRRGRSGRGAARPAGRRTRLADRARAACSARAVKRGDGVRGRSRRPELRVLRLAGARQLRRDQGADPSAGRAAVPRRHRRASATTSGAGGAASGWRPASCRRSALVDTVHGLYIPYWTFDAQVHCPWDAEAGHYYYVTVEGRDSKGRSVTRQERRVRWEAGVRRRRPLLRRRAGARARRGCRSSCCARSSRFRRRRSWPTTPRFSAGHVVEHYKVVLIDAASQSQEQMHAHADAAVRAAGAGRHAPQPADPPGVSRGGRSSTCSCRSGCCPTTTAAAPSR